MRSVPASTPSALPKRVSAPRRAPACCEFIARGYHGDMGWLAASAARRGDPQARCGPRRGPSSCSASTMRPKAIRWRSSMHPGRGVVSVYARGRDYHDTLKRRLKALAHWIEARWPGALKLFVDTAPVMEKPLAERAGLGWQGKHTNLVSREFGSWMFLGEIYLSLALEPDAAETDHCGSCRRCLDACPTAAFPAALSARCSALHLVPDDRAQGDDPGANFRPLIGNRIYGCDDCLAVCPWNKFARASREPDFLPRRELTAPRLAELAELDDAAFRRLFAGTAVKRTGRDRFVRNVLIAIGNADPGDPDLIAAAQRRLDDPSPLVRAAAAWAFSRLAPPRRYEAERARRLSWRTTPW